MIQTAVEIWQSPVGPLYLGAVSGRLTHILFDANGGGALWESRDPQLEAPVIRDAIKQLEEYFEGRRLEFSIPLVPATTPFQKDVRRELLGIPYGAVISYKELAQRIGKPRAVRAAGAANGRNPLSIVVPCHRVVGSDGSLTGYGGTVTVKARLLELEMSVLSSVS